MKMTTTSLTLLTLFLGAVLCAAQTINISGVVYDSAGVGISGAVVKLEKASISTTSGDGGKFTLTGTMTSAKSPVKYSNMAASPIQIKSGKIAITLSEKVPVTISIHAPSGRKVYNYNRTYGLGTHTIEALLQSTGIFIYKVNIGGEIYLFKSSPLGTFSAERSAALSNRAALAKQAKTMAVIADVISVAKEGQLNYRGSIRTSDTSGVTIKMIPNAGNVADVDGNVYQSVRIGNQVWMVENLRTTKYNDGTPIPGPIFTNTLWSGLTTGAYCYYNNDSIANPGKYGALYNWYAVNTGKLAPAGWHVPTDAEWTTLENYLIANGYNWDGSTTGNKIAKSMAAQTDWTRAYGAGTPGNDPNKNNASGFSALPGGFRIFDGNFNYFNDSGGWWSATKLDASTALDHSFKYDNEFLLRGYFYKSLGVSVRLLRD